MICGEMPNWACLHNNILIYHRYKLWYSLEIKSEENKEDFFAWKLVSNIFSRVFSDLNPVWIRTNPKSMREKIFNNKPIFKVMGGELAGYGQRPFFYAFTIFGPFH